jgi:hypothetical protein
MRLTPEPVSVALRVRLTGLVVFVPVQRPPSQLIVVVGAVVSAVTVKLVGAEVRPALFVAVTLLGSAGSVAPVV